MDATAPGSSDTRWRVASADGAAFAFTATAADAGAHFTLRAAALGTYLFYDADGHYLVADAEGALESYARAVEILDSVNDEEALTLALHNLALVHIDQESWDEAETALARCLEIAGRRGDRSVMAGAMLNQAELRCEGEHYPEALERSERAFAIFNDLEDDAGRAAALRVQGEIYRKMRQLEEAEPRLKEAIRIAGRMQLLTLEAEAARELGMVKAGRGDVTSATKWLRRALARFSLMSADDQMHAIEEQLAALKPWRPSGEQKTVKKR